MHGSLEEGQWIGTWNNTESSLPAKLTLVSLRHRSIAIKKNCTPRLPGLHTLLIHFSEVASLNRVNYKFNERILKTAFKTIKGKQPWNVLAV